MGCSVAQIVKSLIFLVDDVPTLALLSGANRLDEARLAAAAGGVEVRRADAESVRSATDFAIGGVPPIGAPPSLAIYIDESLLEHALVWAAAGTPTTVFSVDPHALVAATGGTVAPLAA